MRNSMYDRGPFHNGLRPRRFLADLSKYYNHKTLTSGAGKQFNHSYGQ
jgi:hypothetical protein